MKHLGDIKSISGYDAPTVNVVIVGFPLIWSYLYGNENVLLALEIDDFPIAVTRLRFPD